MGSGSRWLSAVVAAILALLLVMLLCGLAPTPSDAPPRPAAGARGDWLFLFAAAGDVSSLKLLLMR
ncbi:MAG: hypothetical protein H6693_10130 [Candidatus Latescibacteria bacterium]|nr:hypothetical protein [Candidatus Latescibacterota bacterium]